MCKSHESLRCDFFAHLNIVTSPWDVTHSCERLEVFMCETIARSRVRYDLFVCETWLIRMRDMTHSYVRHDSFTRETWLIHVCDVAALTRRTPLWCVTQTKWWWIWDMTHSYMWRGSLNSSDAFVLCDITYITYLCVWHAWFICVSWLIHIWDMTHSYMRRGRLNSEVRRDSFTCETCLIHTWNATNSYVWHDSCTCKTWLIHVWRGSLNYSDAFVLCDMTHSYVWHDSFMCDMTHSYVWHGAFIRETWSIHMCDVAASIHMCNMTHSRVWHDLIIREIWLVHTWDMTRSYVRLELFLRMTWQFKGSDAFTCETCLIHTW